MMDAFKGGMYIENRVHDRTRYMLRNGLANVSTHGKNRETA